MEFGGDSKITAEHLLIALGQKLPVDGLLQEAFLVLFETHGTKERLYLEGEEEEEEGEEEGSMVHT